MKRASTLCLGILLVGTTAWTVIAQEKPTGAPSFTADGKLVRPSD